MNIRQLLTEMRADLKNASTFARANSEALLKLAQALMSINKELTRQANRPYPAFVRVNGQHLKLAGSSKTWQKISRTVWQKAVWLRQGDKGTVIFMVDQAARIQSISCYGAWIDAVIINNELLSNEDELHSELAVDAVLQPGVQLQVNVVLPVPGPPWNF